MMKIVTSILVAFLTLLALAQPVHLASGGPTVDICPDAPFLDRDHRPIFSVIVEPHQTELSAEANRTLDDAAALVEADLVVIQIEPGLRIEININSLSGNLTQAFFLSRLLSRRAWLVEDGLISRGIDASDIQSANSSLFYRVGCIGDPTFVIFMNSPPWEWREQ